MIQNDKLVIWEKIKIIHTSSVNPPYQSSTLRAAIMLKVEPFVPMKPLAHDWMQASTNIGYLGANVLVRIEYINV